MEKSRNIGEVLLLSNRSCIFAYTKVSFRTTERVFRCLEPPFRCSECAFRSTEQRFLLIVTTTSYRSKNYLI